MVSLPRGSARPGHRNPGHGGRSASHWCTSPASRARCRASIAPVCLSAPKPSLRHPQEHRACACPSPTVAIVISCRTPATSLTNRSQCRLRAVPAAVDRRDHGTAPVAEKVPQRRQRLGQQRQFLLGADPEPGRPGAEWSGPMRTGERGHRPRLNPGAARPCPGLDGGRDDDPVGASSSTTAGRAAAIGVPAVRGDRGVPGRRGAPDRPRAKGRVPVVLEPAGGMRARSAGPRWSAERGRSSPPGTTPAS